MLWLRKLNDVKQDMQVGLQVQRWATEENEQGKQEEIELEIAKLEESRASY
jgi:hypothetical protein